MKKKVSLITIVLVLLACNSSYSQRSLPYTFISQPRFNTSNQHFFKQSIIDNEFNSNNIKVKNITYYLNQDNDKDGIGDFRIFLFNTIKNNFEVPCLVSADQSEVIIYKEFPDVMYFLDNQNEKHLPEYINGFYRYSKVLTTSNYNFKHMVSLPILFKIPENTTKKECKVQILYRTKYKKFISLNISQKDNDYQSFIESSSGVYDSNFIDFNTDGSYKLIKSDNTIKTYSVNWIDSYDVSEVVFEITLKW